MSVGKVFHWVHESIDGWVSASSQREIGSAVGECNTTSPTDMGFSAEKNVVTKGSGSKG
jgi:hypothetical protein